MVTGDLVTKRLPVLVFALEAPSGTESGYETGSLSESDETVTSLIFRQTHTGRALTADGRPRFGSGRLDRCPNQGASLQFDFDEVNIALSWHLPCPAHGKSAPSQTKPNLTLGAQVQ